MKHSIISNCINCHNEDTINTLTGLCPDCEMIAEQEGIKPYDYEVE